MISLFLVSHFFVSVWFYFFSDNSSSLHNYIHSVISRISSGLPLNMRVLFFRKKVIELVFASVWYCLISLILIVFFSYL